MTGLAVLGAVFVLASYASMKSEQSIADDLQKRIDEAGLGNVDVKATDRGVTLTAGALNFPPESAAIIPETAARLDAIAELLKGYTNKKLLIEGKGGDMPIASNDTEEGRAKNRRVEITLLR